MKKDNVIIVIPYVDEDSIISLKTRLGYRLPVVFWKDEFRIGSDLAYQTLWNIYKDKDIIILHADMLPLAEDKNNYWFDKLCYYADKFPEAGILGTTLIYPATNIIQHAGGTISNGEAIHIGGGLDLYSSRAHRELERDEGQYDGKVREVPWVTFGGVYIRRSVISAVGNFDPSYYWTYYRDVDYCFSARKLGYKIYQTPVKLYHFEGKDNKKILGSNSIKEQQASINRQIFLDKWANSEYIKPFDNLIYEEDTNE